MEGGGRGDRNSVESKNQGVDQVHLYTPGVVVSRGDGLPNKPVAPWGERLRVSHAQAPGLTTFTMIQATNAHLRSQDEKTLIQLADEWPSGVPWAMADSPDSGSVSTFRPL